MKKNTSICCLLLFALLVFSVGCSKAKKPDGLPELYPLKIKMIYDDGTPAEGVSVQLISTDKTSSQRWNTSAKTDAQGIAVMRTYGEYDGAPAGNYKVVANKEELVFDNATPPQIKGRFNHVEKKYTSIQFTDLTLEVKPGVASAELKIGKAVREAIAGPPG